MEQLDSECQQCAACSSCWGSAESWIKETHFTAILNSLGAERIDAEDLLSTSPASASHNHLSPSHLQLPLHRLPASSPQNHITVLKRACTQFLGVRWLFKLAAVHQPSTTQPADERGGTGRMWVRRCGEFGLYYLDVNTRVASPQMWLPFCAQIKETLFPPAVCRGQLVRHAPGVKGAELWLRFYVHDKEEDGLYPALCMGAAAAHNPTYLSRQRSFHRPQVSFLF